MFRRTRPGGGPFKKGRLLHSQSFVGTVEIVQRAPILSGYKERPRRGVDLAVNLLLTTLAVVAVSLPFGQTDWQRPIRASARQVEQVQNLLLNALAPAAPQPFAQPEWPRPRPRLRLPSERPQNLLATTLAPATPFAQGEWFSPRRAQRIDVVVVHPPNLLVTTLEPAPEPFKQLDWAKPVRPTRSAQEPPQGLLQGTLAPAAAEPFSQSQWMRPRGKGRVSVEPPRNLLATTLAPEAAQVPFSQTEWLVQHRIQRPRVEQVPNLLGTTLAPTVVVDAPFSQPEWSRPQRRVDGPQVLYHRVVLRAEAPFAQLEWGTPARPRRHDAGPYNPNLFGTVLAPAAADAPFSQLEWFSPKRTLRRGDELFLVGLPLLAPLPPEPPEPPAEVQPTPGCYPPSPFRRETLHLRKREAAQPAERATSTSLQAGIVVETTEGTGQGNALVQEFTPRQLPATGPLPQEPLLALPPETDDDEEVLMAMLMLI